jgi:ribosome-associated translation inhibitor RaiA/cold shock CspA family protein
MQSPVQIQFKNMEPSEAVEAAINKWVDKLDRAYPTIITCRVSIAAPSKKKLHGGLYHTRIDIRLPGKEVVVNRNPDLHHSYTDAYVSIRDAFKSAQRQLEDVVKRKQEKVKSHELPAHGWIFTLFPETDSGTIKSSDGREIYFHRNSLLTGNFDELTIGMEVRFVEHEDREELRASSVRLIGKHHIA